MHEQVTTPAFGLQRFCIQDGPGIRTTLFLKGCNLHCAWCHNPEGIRNEPELSFREDRCTFCGRCAGVCGEGVHNLQAGHHEVDRLRCCHCGECVEVCPAGALEMIGYRITIEDAFNKLARDRKYYGEDGGVTLSGGEALLHEEFCAVLLRRLQEAHIHCAVETHGVHAPGTYDRFLPLVDLFLYDYKLTDPERFHKYVGEHQEYVLQNLEDLVKAGASVILRCPIIPGINDEPEHFAAIAQITRQFPSLLGAQILPYHSLGTSKADRIGRYEVCYRLPTASEETDWKRQIKQAGGRLYPQEE